MHLYVTVMLYRVVAYYIPSHWEIFQIVFRLQRLSELADSQSGTK